MRFLRSLAAAAASLLMMTSCGRRAPEYLSHKDWAPDVKAALNDFIDTYRGTENAYAVFDFDNTCSIFDVSEQMMILQIKEMCFNLDPGEFAAMVFDGMEDLREDVAATMQDIADRYGELYRKYGPFSYRGISPDTAAEMAEDMVWKDFAVDICRMYDTLQDCIGDERAYRWAAGWFAGMTEQELYELSLRSHAIYSGMETAHGTWTGSTDSYTWTAIYERDVLGYDLRKAGKNGDILYVLQGRDENGMRSLRPSNSTVRFGETGEKLLCNEDNYTELEYFKANRLTVSEIINNFCISTSADNSPLGFGYGFTSTYPGYKSIK